MDLEVVYDPVAIDIAHGLLMDERHQVLEDGEFVRWLNRLFNKNLFVYFHLETGKFVLAQWLRRDPRVCVEIDTFDAPPDWIADSIEGEYFWRLRLVTTGEMVGRMRRQIADREYEERQCRLETGMSRRSATKFLKKKGMDLEAHMMGTGATMHVGERAAKAVGVHGIFDELVSKKALSKGS